MVVTDKEFDTYLTENLICPYCGKENYDETTEPAGETVCSECGKVFIFKRDYTISYISKKANCQTYAGCMSVYTWKFFSGKRFLTCEDCTFEPAKYHCNAYRQDKGHYAVINMKEE
jgi:transposase-like protein